MSEYFSIIFVIGVILTIPKWPGIAVGAQLFGGPFFSTFLRVFGQEGGAGKFALVLLFLATLVIAWRHYRSLKFSRADAIFSALVIWLAFTYTNTPCPYYGWDKLTVIGLGLAPLLFFARISVCNEILFKQTVKACGWAAAASIVMFMIILVFENHTNVERDDGRYDGGFGPLLVAYNSATAIAFLLIAPRVLTESNSKMRNLVSFSYWILIFSGIFLIIAAGSRGALLAVVVLFIYWYKDAIFETKTTAAIIGGVLIVAAYLSYAGGTDGFERITSNMNSVKIQKDGRFEAFQAGFQQFLAYPIAGQGIGSFSEFVGAGGRRKYPHNGFIELAGEGGVIALIFIIVLIGSAFSNVKSLRKKQLTSREKMAMAILIVGLANFCLSYDFPMQKTIIAGIGFSFGLNQERSRKALPKTKSYRLVTSHGMSD